MPNVFQPDFRAAQTPEAPLSNPAITRADTQDYFTEVADDYRAWSPSYNMHFGFWRLGLNPLRREGMLSGDEPRGRPRTEARRARCSQIRSRKPRNPAAA